MKLCMGCMTNIDDNITTCPHCGYDETTLRQESYYLDPGTVVGGKYIVGRVISYGGYTITYLGMDAENNRKVMVKEYLPSDFSTRSDGETEVTIYSGDAVEQFEQGLTTFLNEANRIQHLENVQGIAKVYDCVAENDTGYVISEYVEGQTLKEILENGRTFTPQEAKDFISQILVGLSQVHPMDIIHCDISPETIMVTNTGEIKLMDFGATRYVTTANSKSLAIILKQGYAPEEQYRSKGVRGPWTDVYALGAVMYRMITGKVPTESVDRALIDELKEPSKLGVAIPQNIENAMMNALNVYQKDRTPSAEVFLQELNSPQVKRIQVKKKKNDTGKFPKWAKGLVAGLLCVVLGVGGVLTYNLVTEESNEMGDSAKRADDIVGKTKENAEKLLEKNDVKLVEEKVIFDNSLGQKEQILAQNPARGNRLTDDTIKCTLLTSKMCNYGDIFGREKNARSLAQFLLIENPDKICQKATKGLGKDAPDSENYAFGNVYGIRYQKDNKSVFISLEEIRKNKDNEEKILKISDIQAIYYYISPFLYNKMDQNYVGKNISDVKFDKCDENKKPTGKEEQPSQNDVYISLSSSYTKGYIVKQNYKIGDEYDARTATKDPFDTVKKQISWRGKSVSTLKKELEEEGFEVKLGGSESDNHPISNVYAEGERNGKLFVKKADTKIVIETQKPTPTPTLEPTPTPENTVDEAPQPKRTPKENINAY